MATAPRPVRPTKWEEPQGERQARRARRRALLARAGLVAAVVGSLVLVVTRQTAGYERERALNAVKQELAVVEAEKVELTNRIQALQTRARITRVARERLGMHVARDDELVYLPLPASPDSAEEGR